MEEMHAERYGVGVQSFDALSRCDTLPKSPHIYSPRSSPNPLLLGFGRDFVM